MAIKWITLRDGVRYYEHASETVPDPDDRRKRRPMRLYYLKYRHGDKVYNESVGSEKLYEEAEVVALADELKANRKKGVPPFTLAERRQASNEAWEAQPEEEAKKAHNIYDTFFNEVFVPLKEHQMLEGNLKQKHLNCLKAMHRLHVKPIIGGLTFDKITDDHFRKISGAMLAPVEKSRQVRDYDTEERLKAEYAAAGKYLRKTRYYKTETWTEPAYSIKMVQDVKAMCHEIWKLAVKKGVAGIAFPGEEIVKGKVNNRRTRFFTPDEIETILEDLKRRSTDVYHYATISAYSGLRISSIFGMTWGDFTDQIARDTKNKDNVSTTIFRAVQRLRDVVAEREAMYPDRKPSDYLFPNNGTNKKGEKPTGGRRSEMTDTYRKCLEDLQINRYVQPGDRRRKAVFHTLRHSFASILVQKGLELPKVSELMGHKSLQQTQQYAHLGESYISEAADIMNDL